LKTQYGKIKETFVPLKNDLTWSIDGLNLDDELIFNSIDDLKIDAKLSTIQEIPPS